MSAIITDQLRILNAENFLSQFSNPENSFYLFLGLPNSEDYSPTWNISPIAPKDNFDEENNYWDSMIALKKINYDSVRRVVKRTTWTSGTIYDMYRHDVSRDNNSNSTNASSLYLSNYYIVNKNFQVYICLYNGITPENYNDGGKPSLEEPTFVDLEPKKTSDGYVWKYLYTITPSEIIKFVTNDYIPVPNNWTVDDSAVNENFVVRNNTFISGQLKIATIVDRGSGLGPENTYTNVPIKGDGSGATATIVINSQSKVESITISNGGSGYTYATVDFKSIIGSSFTTMPTFDVIIPPKGGHGYNIYKELGSYRAVIYTRIENDDSNPDFTTGNTIARIGIVKNPLQYNSQDLVTIDKVSALNALKLIGPSGSENLYESASFSPNSIISQTVGSGITAFGKVISYNQTTGVLKYYQDKTLAGFNTDGTRTTNAPSSILDLKEFTSSPSVGGDLIVKGVSQNLYIDINFGTETNPGITTTINNRTYKLGQSFVKGLSNPEVKKYSGDILYVDNRSAITRSQNQKEDIKVILQF